jgi:head-tail adaptor
VIVIGALRHVVIPEEPGPTVPDNEGGFTQTWAALIPATWHCSIVPATVRDLERAASGTVITTASHVITGRYHPQISTKTRLTKGKRNAQGQLTSGSREFQVTGIQNIEEKNEVLVLLCEEVVS